ncbi:hypothetical protein GCM10007860_13900 [Chitiniphilus shinanonensis]|uniref:Uncharacterized protein n=1 Tax=Chitiniphilus shinanonensis TaxID=553088 RepID=A0ABQ6BRK3_9NEIS|nr:hypothetical protein [Chitiniphilus shinanonensis]GLS04243.1 hypothetical protein GCM10007860_13900 [Chitiniphilus shinanonensis]
MRVPVYFGMSDIDLAAGELRHYGLIVVETTRPHARQLFKEFRARLDIDEDQEDGPVLLHASVSVDDQGWSDFYVYSPTLEYRIPEIHEAVRAAARQAATARRPARFLATVDYEQEPLLED